MGGSGDMFVSKTRKIAIQFVCSDQKDYEYVQQWIEGFNDGMPKDLQVYLPDVASISHISRTEKNGRLILTMYYDLPDRGEMEEDYRSLFLKKK